MQWTYDDYKYYSAEHLNRVQKHQLIQETQRDNITLRSGIRGRRRPRTHQ